MSMNALSNVTYRYNWHIHWEQQTDRRSTISSRLNDSDHEDERQTASSFNLYKKKHEEEGRKNCFVYRENNQYAI